MMECKPESGHCYSLCTLYVSHTQHCLKTPNAFPRICPDKGRFSLHLRGLIPSSRTWSDISLSSVQKTCWLGSFFFSLHVLSIYCYQFDVIFTTAFYIEIVNAVVFVSLETKCRLIHSVFHLSVITARNLRHEDIKFSDGRKLRPIFSDLSLSRAKDLE